MLLHVHRGDYRLSVLNGADATAKALLRDSRTVAMAGFGGGDASKAEDRLRRRLAGLDMSALDVLSSMLMATPVSPAMGATGAGGVWAAATVVLNRMAREELRSRPALEWVE